FLAELKKAGRVTRFTVQPSGAKGSVTGERAMWITAERLPQFASLFPRGHHAPPIVVPEEFAARRWAVEEALVEIVRSRLEGLGPVTATALADSLALPLADIEAALEKLATEGFAMRGAFTSGANQVEWCDRALLARIHRYTVKRLRQEIEPVSSQDFMRFLCR